MRSGTSGEIEARPKGHSSVETFRKPDAGVAVRSCSCGELPDSFLRPRKYSRTRALSMTVYRQVPPPIPIRCGSQIRCRLMAVDDGGGLAYKRVDRLQCVPPA